MIVFWGKGWLCGGGYWVPAQAALKRVGGKGWRGLVAPSICHLPGEGEGQVIRYSHGLIP